MGYKIIHTTCHTQFGGLEKRILNESSWMAQKGHRIIIAAPPDTPLNHRAREKGFWVHDIGFKRTSLARDFFSLKALFNRIRPHILNTHGNEDSKLALCAALGTDIPLRILSRHISAHVKKSWYNRLLYRRLCHYVFTTADYTTRHLIKTFHIPKDRVQTLSSGIIPPPKLAARADAGKQLAAQLGLDPSTRFVGFIGRVSHDKGVDILIRAFHRISTRIPHHLAIIGTGTGEYLSALEACAKTLKIEARVHFTGFREDVWPFYRALDCKILASRNINGIPFEGIPQSVLEAMYAGCPVLGSVSGGIPDIITHGSTGFLFQTEDEKDLSIKLLQILQDEAGTRIRAEKALGMVQNHHTIDAMGNNILKIIDNFLTNPEAKADPTDGEP